MNTVATLVRETMSKRYKHPGKELTRILGVGKQSASNKLCGRHIITINDLAELDRILDFAPEDLKRAIHNFKWGEDLDGDKPK